MKGLAHRRKALYFVYNTENITVEQMRRR